LGKRNKLLKSIKERSFFIKIRISFTDDGQGADSAAGDITYSTRLSPSSQGFVSYAGTVRALVQFTANGQAFALLQFNDEVATGTREFKMQVFGALIHDKQPAFPLRVRDVEGFLFFADRFPDRALLSRQVGVVHTSARYRIDNFSATEWTSEERERYLAEYAHDAELARAQIARLAGR
jgi:hypothetical protein